MKIALTIVAILLIALIIWALLFFVYGIWRPEQVAPRTLEEMTLDGGSRILVVYFSRSGYTRSVAEGIRSACGADLAEIQPSTPYPEKYNDVVWQVRKELSKGVLPEITCPVESIDNYDAVFVGSPVWWGHIAPPVAAFLKKFDFKAKKVMVFVTHGGGGAGHCVQDVVASVGGVQGEALVLRDKKVKDSVAAIENWTKGFELPVATGKR